MTVLKLTKSKKAVQVVTDEGHIYQVSVSSLQFLLNGFAKAGFITSIRMPFNAAPDRYKPSEVWTNNGQYSVNSVTNNGSPLTTTNDALSVREQKKNEKKRVYRDIKI